MRRIEGPEDIRLPKALQFVSRKTGPEYRGGKSQRYVVDLGFGTVLRAASILPELAFRVAVVLEDGRPGVYRSKRVGQNGVIFEALKIRTMREGADQAGSRYEQAHAFHDEDDPRVTKVGAWLRRRDFDEIKNLTNVRRGEMSLVGPRAATPGDEARLQTTLTVDEYIERRQWFEDGRPGVFNAPIAFARDTMKDRDDKLGHEWNRFYAENASVGLDLYIIYKTFSSRFHAKFEKLVGKLRRTV